MNEVEMIFKNMRQHLMNGVSHMIPVVVSGGIIFAVATMISMQSVQSGEGVVHSGLAGMLSQIGGVGLGMMVSVLSAYIAYSIADRPGLAAGFIGGQLAVNVGAGFIGGIFAGILAGISAYFLKKIPLPKSIQSLKSIIIIPLCSVLIVGIIMVAVIGGSCAWLLAELTKWLTMMDTTGAILIGAITGAMIGFDLGGPLNKVAYSTGVAIVGTMVAAGENCAFFGPIAIAIGLPPIGVGIATFILAKKFSEAEKKAAIGSIAMGICGITEGAISYTTADPLRMIPINVISCAIAGAIAGAFGVYCNAAWGGLVILPVTSICAYLLCMGIGICIYVGLCAVFKRDYVEEVAEKTEEEDIDIVFE